MIGGSGDKGCGRGGSGLSGDSRLLLAEERGGRGCSGVEAMLGKYRGSERKLGVRDLVEARNGDEACGRCGGTSMAWLLGGSRGGRGSVR